MDGILGGGEVVWSTGKPTSVAVVQSIVKMAREGKDMTAAGIIPARKLCAAHLRRTRAIDRARSKWGVSAIADESNRLGDLAAEAESAVAGHPVSTATDLRAKLQFMTDHHMGDGMDWLGELLADAERIAAKEGRA